MARGTLFVISAPSGAGKSTLIEEIRPLFPDMLYSVSCTTRAPRENEQEGVHYYFLDGRRFDALVKAEAFLEWKEVHGNRYGTPAPPVKSALASGRCMVLDIDVQGALQVFEKIDESVGIFITVPSMDVLEQRLRQRGSDSEESIRTRLENAPREMELGAAYEYRIVNDSLEKAVAELAAVIEKESRCGR
ncbi:MAG: guanylate kinase [Desulfomonilaceae bacterium]|nr:guanylate kinase [Desulfomonilaceae bacterium]